MRTFKSIVIILTVLIAGGVVLVSVLWPKEKPKAKLAEPGFDYGQHTAAIDLQRERLAKEPCDRSTIVKHAETLFKAGDYRGVLDRSAKFFSDCGQHLDLRWVTFSANKQLSQWEDAIADACKLIEDDPGDFDFWWWRGQAYELSGKLEEAAHDYRQSLLIEPRLESIPFNLATVLERLDAS